jgi:hypothetical protein
MNFPLRPFSNDWLCAFINHAILAVGAGSESGARDVFMVRTAAIQKAKMCGISNYYKMLDQFYSFGSPHANS